jgi:hypothetical protein
MSYALPVAHHRANRGHAGCGLYEPGPVGSWLRRTINRITGNNGLPSRLDTATRMAGEANFASRDVVARRLDGKASRVDRLSVLAGRGRSREDFTWREVPTPAP